jgi:hypothetical protein
VGDELLDLVNRNARGRGDSLRGAQPTVLVQHCTHDLQLQPRAQVTVDLGQFPASFIGGRHEAIVGSQQGVAGAEAGRAILV